MNSQNTMRSLTTLSTDSSQAIGLQRWMRYFLCIGLGLVGGTSGVAAAIGLMKEGLGDRTPLIGFAGMCSHIGRKEKHRVPRVEAGSIAGRTSRMNSVPLSGSGRIDSTVPMMTGTECTSR